MNSIIFGSMSLYEIAMYFFIYAFLGWCSEVIFATLKNGKFVNRGFLNGPLCPVYGVGAVTVMLLLNKYVDNIFILFLASLILTSLLELVTGWFLERFFNKKWWDYTKEPFNIKGYVCLRFAILWGFACVFMLKIIQPQIESLVDYVPLVLGYVLLLSFTIFLIVDLIVTILQIAKLNDRYKQIDELAHELKKGSNKFGEKLSDITLSITKKSKELAEKTKKSRLVVAFPKLYADLRKENKGDLSKNEPNEEVIIEDETENK